MYKLRFLVAAALLLSFASVPIQVRAQGKFLKDSFVGGAQGTLYDATVGKLAPALLDTVGLGDLGQLLFPEPESIDYDRIAEIVGNQIKTDSINNEISINNGKLAGVNNRLRMTSVLENPGLLGAEEHELALIVGIMSQPRFKKEGIATYTLAANTLIKSQLATYKQTRTSEHKSELIATINRSLKHVLPFRNNAIDERLKFIEPYVKNEWEWFCVDKKYMTRIGGIWTERSNCQIVAEVMRNLIKGQILNHPEDWDGKWGPLTSPEKPYLPFVCFDDGLGWTLCINDRANLGRKFSNDGIKSIGFEFALGHEFAFNQFPGDNRYEAAFTRYVSTRGSLGKRDLSGNACLDHAKAVAKVFEKITDEARANYFWFDGYTSDWKQLKAKLVMIK
ncbi:hypothetical protein N9003_01720 [bacterium]|nr:hypothetical protein [bacterium]